MTPLRLWCGRFASLFRQHRLDAELAEELRSHLELAAEEYRQRGRSPEEARTLALRSFGGVTQIHEQYRLQRGFPLFAGLGQDLVFGLRQLRKHPGFTWIGVVSLALAIGANTTIFLIARQVLYDPLQVPHPDQLRLLRWNGDSHVVLHAMWGDFDSTAQGGMTGSIFTYPVFQQLRATNTVLQDLFAFKEDSMNATVRGNAQRVVVAMVSGNYYAGLAVRPQLGRAIQPADDAVPGGGTVAVISDGLWERAFSRSPAVLGQTVKVNQALLTIVGVNPRAFTGAKDVQRSPDLFVPLTLQPRIDPKGEQGALLDDADLAWLNVMGRLSPGVDEPTAQAALAVQLNAAIRSTMKLQPGDTLPGLTLAEGDRGLHASDGTLQKPMYVLLTLTALVLLLACANIATLLLARGAQRQREMSLRLALGAQRSRILRQLLTESLLLATLGGTGGLVLAFFARNALPALVTYSWEHAVADVPFDWGVFAFCSTVTLCTAVLFGMAPAWVAAQATVSGSLKESGPTTTRRKKGLAGKSLVAVQIALSLLLVVGAGLFVRTMMALSAVDVGFNPRQLVLFDLQPPSARYPGANEVISLLARVQQGIAALPGVDRVSLAQTAYIANNLDNSDFLPEGATEKGRTGKPEAELFNVVGADFFQTLQIPMVAGNGFGAQDTATSPPVAIINQALAGKRFPGIDPVGKRFKTEPDAHSPWIRIAGVCANTHYASLLTSPPAQFFLLYTQQPQVRGMVYHVRTRTSPEALAPALRRVVQSIDPDLPLVDLRTQRQQIDATLQVQRALAALTASFGLLALALACVGIYGVMAYSVVQRTSEIGLRLALGAQPGAVRRMILRESTGIAGAGIAAGLCAALALTRWVGGLLFGILPYDPATMAGGALLLLGIALAASWVPARRAAGVPPMQALRHE